MKFIKHYNRIFVYLITFVIGFCFFSSSVLASEINSENVINLVNQSRKDKNVGILEENEKLAQAAKEKLDDMFGKDYFAHNSPSGVTPWFWIEKAGYDYQYAGENLALGFTTAEAEHKAWMDSPSHKKNILNPNYKEIGVAVGNGIINNNTVTVAVQMFGARMENSAGSKDENNLSDDKSQELLEKSKKENIGIVLNTDNFGDNGRGTGIFQNSQELKDMMLGNKNFLKDTVWLASFAILAACMIFNIAAIFIFVFHRIAHHLRRNRNAFMIVNSIMILILMGSLVF